MKIFLLLVIIQVTSCSMNQKNHLEVLRKKANNDQELLQELNDPIFVDCEGKIFFFTTHYNEQDDNTFNLYKNKLKKKLKKQELNKKIKEKQRIDILYQRVSILCIILGHISGIW